MRKIFYVLLASVLFSACKFEEPVTFKQIDKVKIESISNGMVNLSAQAVFYNPNELKGKLKDVNILVDLDGKTLATITQSEALKIAENAEFSIPINIEFAMEDVQQGLLKNLVNILSGNFVKLHFVGDIKVSTFVFTQKVDVDYYEEVKLQL
jgi:hypothetical protein